MDEMESYYENSIRNGSLCDEYLGMWRACKNDKDALIKLAMSTPAIPQMAYMCANGKGVSKDFLLKEYGQFLNGETIEGCDGIDGFKYNMYVSYPHVINAVNDVYHIMWSDVPQLRVPTSKCPRIYISNGSTVRLSCDGYNSLHIYLFDSSRLIINDADDTCHIDITRYGADSNIEVSRYAHCSNLRQNRKNLKYGK